MSQFETATAESADTRLSEAFIDLHPKAQAVLAYTTLSCLRNPWGYADLYQVSDALSIGFEELWVTFEYLEERGEAWLLQSREWAETAIASEMLRLSIGPGGRPSPKQWQELRARAFHIADLNGRRECKYCGEANATLALDHMVPVSRGGSIHIANLVLACVPCNSAKKDRTVEEWRRQAWLSDIQR